MRISMDPRGRRSLSFGPRRDADVRDADPVRAGTSARRALLATASLLLATLVSAPGCSSGGTRASAAGAKTGQPVELRYRAIAKNLSFGLVNESHTDRTELYSARQPLDKATTKVSPDEVVDAIVEYFRDQGYFDIAQPGAAPRTPPPGASQILEVMLPEGSYHAVMAPGVSPDFITKFQTCSKALLDVYNSTMQLQAVENAPDWSTGSTSSRTSGKTKSGAAKSGG